MSYLIVEAAGTGPDAETARLELHERLAATDERHGKADPDAELKLWRRALAALMRSNHLPAFDRLRIWRHANEKGFLTIAEAAKRRGVSVSAWADWETGRHVPHPYTREGLESLTGIPAADWR